MEVAQYIMMLFLMVIKNEEERSKLEQIYRHYSKDLFIAADLILKDSQEAEDVVQKAIIRISGNLDKISEIKCKKTRAYLVTIVKNLCYTVYQHKNNYLHISQKIIEQTEENSELDIEDYIVGLDKRKDMARMLHEIHKPYGDVLMLRFYQDLSIEEISDMLNISKDNVSVRIYRGLRAIESMIGKEGE